MLSGVFDLAPKPAMTNRELIEKLSTLPLDQEICVYVFEDSYYSATPTYAKIYLQNDPDYVVIEI